MSCALQCTCGTVQGVVDTGGWYNRCRCYCRDCQSFPHYLGKADEILDAQGGTLLLQTLPARVRFTAGQDKLACISLSGGRLLRWYTKCCNTPIANTPGDYKLSFAGVFQTCLRLPQGDSFDAQLGPVSMAVYTKFAKADPKPKASSMLRVFTVLVPVLLKARLDGSYRQSAFFTPDGKPIVPPKILGAQEREKVQAAL